MSETGHRIGREGVSAEVQEPEVHERRQYLGYTIQTVPTEVDGVELLEARELSRKIPEVVPMEAKNSELRHLQYAGRQRLKRIVGVAGGDAEIEDLGLLPGGEHSG